MTIKFRLKSVRVFFVLSKIHFFFVIHDNRKQKRKYFFYIKQEKENERMYWRCFISKE